MNSEAIQATVQENLIHLGSWTDWSRGSITGATITTTQRNGGFLIAFIALFVAVTGTSFWTIVAFVQHQISSSEAAQDAVYHQRQAILRNSDTSAAGLWKLLRLLWAWHRRYKKLTLSRRICPSLLLSLVTLSTFAVAGIFSSKVAISRGSVVLVDGTNCGITSSTNVTINDTGSFGSYSVQRLQSSSNYALNCYRNNSFAQNCRTFVRPSLPFNITRGVACPFPGKNKICRSSAGGIRFDSGLINSHSDLGINAPGANRFDYRLVKECAPIRNKGYAKVNDTSFPAVIDFFFGPTYDYKNSTYQYAISPALIQSNGTSYKILEYVLSPAQYYALADPDTDAYDQIWTPIEDLLVPNADMSIFFLSPNDIQFLAPVNDPWFSATTPATGIQVSNLDGLLDTYMGDDPTRAVVCVEQYQICNPNLPAASRCTPLEGIQQAWKGAVELFAEGSQREKFVWSGGAIFDMAAGLPEITGWLGVAALQARGSLSGGMQDPLPDNQWEFEFEHWFKIVLAEIQRAVLDHATGPIDPKMRQYLITPNSTDERSVCSSQRIRSDSFTSFSRLGLTIIFSIGGTIILISWVLPTIVERVQRRRSPFKALEWATNGTLQLQRLAHEGLEVGTWQSTCDTYPVTARGELLAVLDVSNAKHPVLRALNSGNKSQATPESTNLPLDSQSSDSSKHPAAPDIEPLTPAEDLVSFFEDYVPVSLRSPSQYSVSIRDSEVSRPIFREFNENHSSGF
ncbi:hypothetical protein N0V90_007404 [Kalmusia sp. IMI 367209]|nr:hypothetical protein N0V90_007404 [Kalmusia sp. IMI 367209]